MKSDFDPGKIMEIRNIFGLEIPTYSDQQGETFWPAIGRDCRRPAGGTKSKIVRWGGERVSEHSLANRGAGAEVDQSAEVRWSLRRIVRRFSLFAHFPLFVVVFSASFCCHWLVNWPP